MKKLRAGIIGQGRSGFDIHAHLMGRMPDRFRIVAVADHIEETRARSAQTLKCDVYDNHRALLARDDLDLVVNATPSHLHAPISMETLDAGHNVLCEKPLARYASEVDALIAKAKETGKLFAIFQQARFGPYLSQVKKVIASGVLGRVVMVKIAFNHFGRRWDWQTVHKFNGGNLLNTGPHPLDQALQIFGTDIMPDITCLMDRANTFGDAEDHVKLLLSARGRPTIDIEVSSCCAYPLYSYQVYGTHGGLTGNMEHIEWKYYLHEEMAERKLIPHSVPNSQYCSEKIKWHLGKWDVPKTQADQFDYMGQKLYRNVWDAITSGAPLVVTPEQIRQQIAVIEECHRQNAWLFE